MTLDITADLRDVKIMPETELEEIAQNVQMILATQKLTVPMDRAFGLTATLIDQPIAASQARMTAEIAASIREQEPRVRVQQVFYDGEFADGQLGVRVRVEVVERNLRGGVF